MFGIAFTNNNNNNKKATTRETTTTTKCVQLIHSPVTSSTPTQLLVLSQFGDLFSSCYFSLSLLLYLTFFPMFEFPLLPDKKKKKKKTCA